MLNTEPAWCTVQAEALAMVYTLEESRHAQQVKAMTRRPDQKVTERWRASFTGGGWQGVRVKGSLAVAGDYRWRQAEFWAFAGGGV